MLNIKLNHYYYYYCYCSYSFIQKSLIELNVFVVYLISSNNKKKKQT